MNQMYWRTRNKMRTIADYIGKNIPLHIPTRRPKCPNKPCSCGGTFSELIAIDTGDGWALAWDCTRGCGDIDEGGLEGWWPFWFGAWAKWYHLEHIGIRCEG